MQEQTSDTSTMQPQQAAAQGATNVATPNRKKPGKKGKFIKIFLILVVILGLLGGGAWFLLRDPQIEEDIVDNRQELTSPDFQEPTEAPTPTVKPANKEDIKIQILNGTGIPGEAGKLKETLEELDYVEIEVDNANTQDYVITEVTFAKSISESLVEELTDELEDVFADVKTSTAGSLGGFDIKIIIGYKIGYTPAPTKVPATPTATPKVTGTITPTATPTDTPTTTP